MFKPLLQNKTLAALAGAALLAGGCTTPDLKPFADATANLHQVVGQSQDIVQSELQELQQRQALADEAKLKAAETKFTNAFAQRIAFMTAVVDYSDSLAAVADAGKNGEANAQALENSIKQLLDAAGPYGAAVGVGADVLAKIYGLGAQAWAAHSLKEATAKANPIIAVGAEILQQDMNNIRQGLATAETPLVAALEKPYRHSLTQRLNLMGMREEQSREFNGAMNPTNWPALLADYNRRLAEVNTFYDTADKWYLPLQAQESALHTRLATEIQLLDKTAMGLKQWAKIHADLTQTLKNNRQPNLRVLLSTIMEIKTDIETLKSK